MVSSSMPYKSANRPFQSDRTSTPQGVAVARAFGLCRLTHRSSACPVPKRQASARAQSPAASAAPTREDPCSSAATAGSAPSEVPQDFHVAVYSAQQYVLDYLQRPLEAALGAEHVRFIEARLDKDTAELARGCTAVCLFVNDICDSEVVNKLADGGVRYIAMRCAGFDRVDLEECERRGVRVVRVPAYSPRSVAEHAMALAYALARELKHQMRRVEAGNYTLSGIVGLELSYKTYGVVGTGNIGIEMIKLLRAFDGRILAYDPFPNPAATALGVEYVELETLLRESDLISLHCPLMASTHHLMNEERFNMLKPSCILINVSRGGLINTNALIAALETNKLGGVAMDVYEKEGNIFDEDFTEFSSRERMHKWDRQWAYLKYLPQAILTPHSAFCTHEALKNIADTTCQNLLEAAAGGQLSNEVKPRA